MEFLYKIFFCWPFSWNPEDYLTYHQIVANLDIGILVFLCLKKMSKFILSRDIRPLMLAKLLVPNSLRFRLTSTNLYPGVSGAPRVAEPPLFLAFMRLDKAVWFRGSFLSTPLSPYLQGHWGLIGLQTSTQAWRLWDRLRWCEGELLRTLVPLPNPPPPLNIKETEETVHMKWGSQYSLPILCIHLHLDQGRRR